MNWWLKQNDLHVATDLQCDCPREMDDDEHQRKCRPYGVFALSTLDDRSVGIFPEILTPWFPSMTELFVHIAEHREAIEAKLEAAQ